MSILILKFLSAAIFVSAGLLMLYISTRSVKRESVPESVFERVVNWRLEIQQMDDFLEKCRQLDEWRAFIREIPESKRKGFKLIKK